MRKFINNYFFVGFFFFVFWALDTQKYKNIFFIRRSCFIRWLCVVGRLVGFYWNDWVSYLALFSSSTLLTCHLLSVESCKKNENGRKETRIRGSLNKFPDFFVRALLLIVHIWNSSPLRSNLLRLQCTCCTVLTTSGRLYGSPLVWACQWPSSRPLSSPQLSHNNSLWA